MGCENCGSYDCEQENHGDYMTVTCLKCGFKQYLTKYRDEGEDKWRDDRDDDSYYR